MMYAAFTVNSDLNDREIPRSRVLFTVSETSHDPYFQLFYRSRSLLSFCDGELFVTIFLPPHRRPACQVVFNSLRTVCVPRYWVYHGNLHSSRKNPTDHGGVEVHQFQSVNLQTRES